MTNINDYPAWRQKLSFILDFLIVFELIINTHSVYYFALDRDYYTLYILAGLICIQLVVLPTAFLWEHLKKLLPVAGAWSAYIIIYALVSGGDLKRLLAKFIVLLLLLFVYFYGHMVRGTIKQLFKHYIDIVFIIALIAVFMWLTCSVLKWFPATRPFRIEWGADRRIWSFYGIYFHWQNDHVRPDDQRPPYEVPLVPDALVLRHHPDHVQHHRISLYDDAHRRQPLRHAHRPGTQ